jgi:hypothetical protein
VLHLLLLRLLLLWAWACCHLLQAWYTCASCGGGCCGGHTPPRQAHAGSRSLLPFLLKGLTQQLQLQLLLLLLLLLQQLLLRLLRLLLLLHQGWHLHRAGGHLQVGQQLLVPLPLVHHQTWVCLSRSHGCSRSGRLLLLLLLLLLPLELLLLLLLLLQAQLQQ